MRHFALVATLVVVSAPAWAQEVSQNPCEDAVYNHLAQMIIDGRELSESERETYNRKDAACIRYQEQSNQLQQEARPGTADEMLSGVADGRADAEEHKVGGSFVGGLAGGLLGGLIGTGIAYAVQTQPDLTNEQQAILIERAPEYQLGYTDAYKSNVQRRKRSQALVGGLVGTGILVGVILIASNSGS